MFEGDVQGGGRLHLHLGVQGGGEHWDRRRQAKTLAGDHANGDTQVVADRQAIGWVVAVAGLRLLMLAR